MYGNHSQGSQDQASKEDGPQVGNGFETDPALDSSCLLEPEVGNELEYSPDDDDGDEIVLLSEEEEPPYIPSPSDPYNVGDYGDDDQPRDDGEEDDFDDPEAHAWPISPVAPAPPRTHTVDLVDDGFDEQDFTAEADPRAGQIAWQSSVVAETLTRFRDGTCAPPPEIVGSLVLVGTWYLYHSNCNVRHFLSAYQFAAHRKDLIAKIGVDIAIPLADLALD